MEIIDIIISIILLIGLFRGLKNGLIREVTSLLGLILGIYLAINYSHIAENYLIKFVEWNESIIKLTAFTITFLFVISLLGLLGGILTKLASALFLGWVNKFFGAIFGVLKVGLILSILLMVFDSLNKQIPFMDKDKFSESVLYTPIKNLAQEIFPNLIVTVKEEVNKK